MQLPRKLALATEGAFRAVLRHPQNDLNLGYRHAIWAALNPDADQLLAIDNVGLKRRTNLAIITTQYVLPIWASVFPDENLPQYVLTRAKDVLSGKLDKETAWTERAKYWRELFEIGDEGEQYDIVTGVGFSAVQALTCALQDECFDPSNIDYELTDADIDAEELDSSYFAAAAYSGGTIWEPYSDSSKRRQFWEWWLDQAVLAAWRSVS